MAPRGRVYAFEPAAYARSVMAPAVALSGLRNIIVVPKGLSDTPGELVLRTPRKRWGSLGFGTAPPGRGRGWAEDALEEVVTLTTLDAFAADVGLTRLDLIKADVEGWELRALRGGEATLRRFRPALFIEVDAAMLGATPATLRGNLWSLARGPGLQRLARPRTSRRRAPAYESEAADYLFLAAESP